MGGINVKEQVLIYYLIFNITKKQATFYFGSYLQGSELDITQKPFSSPYSYELSCHLKELFSSKIKSYKYLCKLNVDN